VKLTDVEDLAAKHGFSELQEARFANEALDTEQTGVMHLRLKPGVRHAGDAEMVPDWWSD
jgi:hypothetical protein